MKINYYYYLFSYSKQFATFLFFWLDTTYPNPSNGLLLISWYIPWKITEHTTVNSFLSIQTRGSNLLLVARKSTWDKINDSLITCLQVHFSKVVTVQVIENISCICIAWYKHKSQGLGEFSQPLECLHQAIYANTRKKFSIAFIN